MLPCITGKYNIRGFVFPHTPPRPARVLALGPQRADISITATDPSQPRLRLSNDPSW
jgi:hypothetical protein